MARGPRDHAIVLVLMILAVGCKTRTDPKPSEEPTTDAAATDGGGTANDAASVPDATPAPPVVRHDGRDLEETPPPQAKSAMPTSWDDGADLFVRGRHECSAVLKREWVRMSCRNMASVALLAGSVDGVMLDVHEPPRDPRAAESFGPPQRDVTGVAIFPVRRGDRRLFQFNAFHQGVMNGYESSPDSVTPGPVVSEVWLDGDKGPRLEAD